MVKDLGYQSSYPRNFALMNDTSFFVARMSYTLDGLSKSDGTPAGTVFAGDITHSGELAALI
jgi:ELWxxDGT repeat protein